MDVLTKYDHIQPIYLPQGVVTYMYSHPLYILHVSRALKIFHEIKIYSILYAEVIRRFRNNILQTLLLRVVSLAAEVTIPIKSFPRYHIPSMAPLFLIHTCLQHVTM
jgi:hypothetical protein